MTNILEVEQLKKHFPDPARHPAQGRRPGEGRRRRITDHSQGRDTVARRRIGLRQDDGLTLHRARFASDIRRCAFPSWRRPNDRHCQPRSQGSLTAAVAHANDLSGPVLLAQPAHDRRRHHRRADADRTASADAAVRRARVRRAARARAVAVRLYATGFRMRSRAGSASASALHARSR